MYVLTCGFVNAWLVGDIIASAAVSFFPPKLKECFVGVFPLLVPHPHCIYDFFFSFVLMLILAEISMRSTISIFFLFMNKHQASVIL